MAANLQKITNFPTAAKRFVREARDELKKVSWPTREITVRYTIIVVAASIVIGMVIGGIDYLFTLFIEQLI